MYRFFMKNYFEKFLWLHKLACIVGIYRIDSFESHMFERFGKSFES